MSPPRSAADTPLIAVENITKRFPGVVALDGVTFDVRAGEFHSVVGENGAGKSTLMKILSGVITDFEGMLRISGDEVRFANTRKAEAAGISIIHQELNLVEDLSAAANVFLGRERRMALGLLDDRAMQRAAATLFAELECNIRPDQPVRRLRVGDQQLVEIAKALSQDASILIMDEPTSALTESEVERLFRIIERLLARGVTIVYISHKLDEVFRRSDRITVLRDGKHVRTMARGETSPRELTHLMVGREISSFHHAEGRAPGEVVLDVKSLSLPWTGHARSWRLRNVSFQLRRGEVLGVAGLMGAGRTELLECLFGTSPEAPVGQIVLEGKEVHFASPADAKRAGVALVTEDRKRLGLFPQLNVRENITVCMLEEAATASLISARKERHAARESIDLLSIKTPGTEAAITGLSGGNQQKAIIARWLRTHPKVLLLDDPTRGVDVGAKAELYRVIDRLCREGIGIIVTSSELPELITLCDRILVLCEGRLTGTFERGEFTEQTLMEAATRREV
ncbi:MAG TPA: sugar ABC transporter ATP-binding protein [Planctomycetaceae bacterium]|jgi:ABC-type sugar transport system ATPase subunit|nr:sugar ABC transporter ATP-binding protein [Planctomycetaceae bacterium]